MPPADAAGSAAHTIVEPKVAQGSDRALQDRFLRLEQLERLVRAVEEELSDQELSDEQKLQNIGERVASVMDGR